MTADTYHAVVQVYKLGSYKFKGSSEEVAMAHMILDTYSTRKFPPGWLRLLCQTCDSACLVDSCKAIDVCCRAPKRQRRACA
jgi:hypothetical protein